MNSSETRAYDMGARAETTRQTSERILDAAQEAFFNEPYEDVTLQAIASEAGYSVQTLLRHFSSKEELLQATTDALGDRIEAGNAGVSKGDVTGALDATLERYEWMGDGNILILSQEARVEPLGQLSRFARARHRAWLEEVFADHLPAQGDPARERRLLQILLLCDVYSWKLMRRDHDASLESTRVALLELLELVLDGSSKTLGRQT